MGLDLSSLEKAFNQLQLGHSQAVRAPENELMRDGVIQRFEYTYELAAKFIKRYLELTEASSEAVDQLSFRDLVAKAHERGLLANGWETWSAFRTARGTTSHTYDPAKAAEVFEAIPEFMSEINSFISELKSRPLQA